MGCGKRGWIVASSRRRLCNLACVAAAVHTPSGLRPPSPAKLGKGSRPAFLDAHLADPDRRLRDLLALRPWRDRVHADFRRHRGLNLSHGAIMVAAAVAAWAASGNLGAGAYLGAAFGVLVALALALATYYLVVRRLQMSRAVREEEKEIFILTATLLWGIMIQEAIAYLLHQQRQDRAADRRGRGRDPRRPHAGERDFHRARLLGDDRGYGCSSIARLPARRCSPPR